MDHPKILNNRYHIEEPQATGGMATVFRAYDLTLERNVAIKILRKDFSTDPDFQSLFRQEAKAVANLAHPNIVTIHDFGMDQGQLFLVMEFVPGTDLKNIIRQGAPLQVDDAIHLISQACSGIGYAHHSGIVHCDIKPQNILVTPDGLVKVVDFGIARVFATISPDEKSDIVWGSPTYFSPEQARGLAPSPASDVYSLGVVLYEMLTGEPPFNGKGPEELSRQHREDLPPSPRRLNPAIPPELEHILLVVLSKEPSARYRNADQLGQVLLKIPQSNGSIHPGLELLPIANRENSSISVEDSAASPVSQKPLSIHAHQPGINQTIPRVTDRIKSKTDLLTWFLVLLTIVSVGGLIPFWIWVYTILRPPL